MVEGDEQVCGSTNLAQKSAGITDFCDKLNGLEDFENRSDHVSAGNFGRDSGLYPF